MSSSRSVELRRQDFWQVCVTQRCHSAITTKGFGPVWSNPATVYKEWQSFILLTTKSMWK